MANSLLKTLEKEPQKVWLGKEKLEEEEGQDLHFKFEIIKFPGTAAA